MMTVPPESRAQEKLPRVKKRAPFPVECQLAGQWHFLKVPLETSVAPLHSVPNVAHVAPLSVPLAWSHGVWRVRAIPATDLLHATSSPFDNAGSLPARPGTLPGLQKKASRRKSDLPRA